MTPFFAHYLDQAAKLRATHQDRRNRVWHALANIVTFGCLLLLLAGIPLPGQELLGNRSAHASVGLAVGVACALYFALFDPFAALLVALLVGSPWVLSGGADPLAGVSGPMRVVSLLAVFLVVGLSALAGHWLFQDRTVSDPPAPWYHEVGRILYTVVFSAFYFVLFLLLELGYRPALRRAIENKTRLLAEEYIQIRQGRSAPVHKVLSGGPS
jgi:uncharacterized membrane protein YGL010W